MTARVLPIFGKFDVRRSCVGMICNGKPDGALLDALFDATGLEYFSDMKRKDLRIKLLWYLQERDFSEFSLPQWSYALTYILGEEVSFSSAEDLKRFLKSDTGHRGA